MSASHAHTVQVSGRPHRRVTILYHILEYQITVFVLFIFWPFSHIGKWLPQAIVFGLMQIQDSELSCGEWKCDNMSPTPTPRTVRTISFKAWELDKCSLACILMLLLGCELTERDVMQTAHPCSVLFEPTQSSAYTVFSCVVQFWTLKNKTVDLKSLVM